MDTVHRLSYQNLFWSDLRHCCNICSNCVLMIMLRCYNIRSVFVKPTVIGTKLFLWLINVTGCDSHPHLGWLQMLISSRSRANKYFLKVSWKHIEWFMRHTETNMHINTGAHTDTMLYSYHCCMVTKPKVSCEYHLTFLSIESLNWLLLTASHERSRGELSLKPLLSCIETKSIFELVLRLTYWAECD